MRAVVSLIHHNNPGSIGHEKVTYFDGHDSHMDHEALSFMVSEKLNPRFLKSNDSINDQPLDVGVNAMIAKHYNDVHKLW